MARGVVGTDAATYTREAPGMSAFALEDGAVYHAYSTYIHGLDALWGMLPVARSRAARAQRDPDGPRIWKPPRWRLVAPPRRVRQGLREVVVGVAHRGTGEVTPAWPADGTATAATMSVRWT
jgi:hypothetical protein